MENSKEEWTEKVSVNTIVDDLERYRHGKRVLAKLQKDKEWFAKVGMPDLYYEEQAKIRAKKQQELDAQKLNNGKSILYKNQNTEELLVAHEPMPEYNAQKQEEK